LSGYRGFTGRWCQSRRENNRLSKTFDLVLHDRLLTKIAATGVDLRVVVWVKLFLLGGCKRFNLDGQITEEVRLNPGVPQWSLLVPLLFLA